MSATNRTSSPSPLVMAGHLNLKPKGIIKRQKKQYVKLFRQSTSGVARLEIYDKESSSVSGEFSLVILASNVMTINNYKAESAEFINSFKITTKDSCHHVFGASTSDECDSWVKTLQNTLLGFQAQSHETPSDNVMVENDLYATAEDLKVMKEYRVSIEGDCVKALGVSGEVKLIVDNRHITVISKEGNLITRWGVEQLRRFGYDENAFSLEAGRKSMLGEGRYAFVTKEGKQIHHIVTKEKEECRRRQTAAACCDNKSKLPDIPVGQVKCPPTDMGRDSPPLPIGGHVYEEFPSLNLNKAKIPDKPPRNIKKGEQLYPPPPTSPPPQVPYNPVKSQPTKAYQHSVNVPTKPSEFRFLNQPATNGQYGHSPQMDARASHSPFLRQPQSQPGPTETAAGIYSVPEYLTEAWKTHGIGDDELYANSPHNRPPKESVYDVLHQLPPAPLTESHYEFVQPPIPSVVPSAPSEQVIQTSHQRDINSLNHHQQPNPQQATAPPPPVKTEAIYAEINPATKKPKAATVHHE